MKPAAVGSFKRIVHPPQLCLWLSGLCLLAGIALSLGDFAVVSPWLRIIVGLSVFVLPGAYLFVLFPPRESWDLIDAFGYGFVFSVALITLLGLATRTLSWSIDTVESIWYALAIFGFASAFRKFRRRGPRELRPQAPILSLLAIITALVLLFAHSSVLATPTTDDQDRHHTVVNGFLRDEPLGWAEPYYETGNTIADRMYLTYWVLAQALVVEISGAPILLARYLINPFALAVTVAAMYIFARNLNHKPKASLVFVILGLFGYSLVSRHPPLAGWQFFVRPLLDKVLAAMCLAPIAISSAYLCSVANSRRAYLAFGLSTLAAAFVHPVLGGFAVCILAIWCMLRFVVDPDGRRNVALIALIAAVIFAPAVLIRLTTAETTIYNFDNVSEQESSGLHILDTVNPLDGGNNLYMVDSRSVGPFTYVLLLLVPVALAARRRDPRSLLLLAYLLGIGAALLPYTAWVYGRLVSLNHIDRILWLMPYGYMLGYVIGAAFMLLSGWFPGVRRVTGGPERDWPLVLILALTVPLASHYLGFNYRVDFSRDISTVTGGDQELHAIAEYIDARHDERVWVAASQETRSRAAAIHWKVIGLSRFSAERMSYYSKLPIEQAEMQHSDNFRLYNADVPVEAKLAIIDRYGIGYLLFPKGYAWMVDALYQTDKERFELVYSGETLRLVRVHAMAGASE